MLIGVSLSDKQLYKAASRDGLPEWDRSQLGRRPLSVLFEEFGGWPIVGRIRTTKDLKLFRVLLNVSRRVLDHVKAKRKIPAIKKVIMLSAILSFVIFLPVFGSLPFNMAFTRLFLSDGFALLSATIFWAVDCRT